MQTPEPITLTAADQEYFDGELALHEARYLAGTNPRQQSGFGRDERDWERFRRVIVTPVDRDGAFLDIGCANGLLMECLVRWAAEDGHRIEPYGLDISAKLADLARRRLPHWRDRIFVGNALTWTAPARYDYVRTELVYVPDNRRQDYIRRLLDHVVAPDGRLLICSYGSSRPEGARAEPMVDDIRAWGLVVKSVHDVASETGGFVVTRVIVVTQ